jgi:glycosyltransferase involved in cell wall biosynthesis
MRIAHVVDSMEVGGAETLVLQMCRLQREQGHEPCVYAIAALGALGERMREEGFAVQPNVGRHLPDATRNFYRIFKESHPDVVHLHNPTPTVYAAMAARMAGVPSIISTRHSLVARPRRLIVELKYAFAASFCDWIVGICDATTNNLKSIHTVPARKITRVYNGAAPMARVAKEQWPPKSGFTLVYVGRLAAVKNHALLLKAFRAALSNMPSLRLWMVGDGSERKMLESLAGELGISAQVTFWGQQLDVAPFFPRPMPSSCRRSRRGCPCRSCRRFRWECRQSLQTWAEWQRLSGWRRQDSLCLRRIPRRWPRRFCGWQPAVRSGNNSRRTQIEAFHSHFTLQAMVDAYMDLYRNTSRARRAAMSAVTYVRIRFVLG